MYYEINISRIIGTPGRYTHFFATAERSITDSQKCEQVYKELVRAFPEPEYVISITKYIKSGILIDPSDIHGKGESAY